MKPGLENIEHYFTSVWDECSCAVVSAFFGIVKEFFCDIETIRQETVSKTIPKKKKCKKAKWLSQEVSQIAVKRREAKSKGEKETYSHLNAEFPRIARRGKKAFLSGNRIGVLINPMG